MGLKKTRVVLTIILSVIISCATALTLVAAVLNSTFATTNFLSKYLVNDQLITSCNEQLDAKYAALEDKCGIPSRVFLTIKSDVDTGDSLRLAVANLFSDESSTLYSNERTEYFYRLCTEYLEGNDIKYKEDDVRLACKEATEIYSESVGIHNADSITNYLSTYKRECAKIVSASLLVIVLCAVLISIMYKKREVAFIHIFGAIAGGGIATTLSSILALVLKLGSHFDFSPIAYQQSFYNMAKHNFMFVLLAGIICTIAAYGAQFTMTRKIDDERKRQKTRFSKMLGRL